MTTRHTITHADELYAGNAFKGGYSPDGRRGIKMTHLYYHHFLSTAGAAVIAADNDGIFSSYAAVSLLSASGGNWISAATGALVSAGSTVINFDVPRNIVVRTSDATSVIVKFEGTDQYGEPMAEAITVSGGNYASGRRCFKTITKIFATAAFSVANVLTMGTGNRLGLPFHLQSADRIVAITKDGRSIVSAAATGAYTIHIGASSATTMTSSGKQPDARGDILFAAPFLPNATIKLCALMEVDHTTNRAAFGPPQVSSCSNG